MLRVALLSLAHVHANGYAEHIRNHPEAKIQAIWEDDAARGKAAQERFGVEFSSDLEQVLARDDVDAVAISSYTSQHYDLIKAAVRHKKHIFTEKTLAISTDEADELVKEVEQSGVKFMISLPSRVRPETLFFRQVLDQGLLGRITLMRARVAHSAALDHWFHDGSAWFADEQRAGGGALFDLGCHTVDMMRWFMGEPKNVVAKIQQFSDAYAIDDNSAIVIEFKSGALGILDTSWVQRAGPAPLEIYGTDGFVGRDFNNRVQLVSTQLEPKGIAGVISPTKLPEAQPMPMDQWISAILHGTPMTINIHDGRNLVEMLEGAYRAARQKSEYIFQNSPA